MKKDDEMWLKKMREMLIEYDEPAPAGSWERLDKELHFSVERRIIPKQIWAAAAAVLLLTVSGISYYFLNSSVAEEIRTVSAPQVNTVPDVLPVAPVNEGKSARIEPVENAPGTSISLVAHTTIKTSPGNNIIPEIKESENSEPVTEKTEKEENSIIREKEVVTDKQPVEENNNENRQMARPSGKDKFHLPVGGRKTSSSDNGKNWSMGLSVNSLGSNSLEANDGGSSVPRSMSMVDFANIGQSSVDYVEISNSELKFENGLPYLMESATTYDHKQPITFGMSVRKGITSSISLETGLTYTYLASDIHQNGSKRGEQKLHYVGIPIRANWSFVNTNKFNVYLNAGGAVEKCVYGKTDGESNTVKPLQFSLAGGVGAQFNITKKLGIYAEPGVAYFFDDGSDTQTIRKEKKFNINLQAGLRLTY